ncbi:MAG: peptidoglycan-binding protein [Candidatus Omnitrophica bacterium]|nr:peptidoglycan-binding protein [Candidatus Omnitrophota bacterium]
MLSVRILLIGGLAMLLSGCVTTQGNKSNVDQLQIRVVDLEKKLEERESEIVDLKYQVKDLSNRVPGESMIIEDEPPVRKSSAPSSDSSASSSDKVIKVSASTSDVQKALKNAGFYKGSIDGKIGQQTKKAIESFQRQHNLTADGVIGRRTWEELKVYLQ